MGFWDASKAGRLRIRLAAEHAGRILTDRIEVRTMTANHLSPQWRDALGIDGQALVDVYTNVSELRRIAAERDAENEMGF